MRIEKILKMAATPWAIAPHSLRALCATATSTPHTQEILEEEREDREPDGGVAVIPISGIIDHDVTPLDALFGSVDVDDIRDDIEDAIANPEVSAIVLDFDSPGGVITGVPELAEFVAEASKSKPIVAFTDSMMCSAAYWIAAGASAIVASPSSDVGSIGVYIPVMDVSGFYERNGVKVEIIKAGDLKAAGYPGTSLSEDQREDLQTGVDAVYQMFRGHVAANRRGATDSAMRGQSVLGASAVAAGLVDGVGMLWDAKKLAADLGRLVDNRP
jgi:signal peptide peptidase SppA